MFSSLLLPTQCLCYGWSFVPTKVTCRSCNHRLSQNEILFGGRDFQEVIKIKGDHIDGWVLI